MGQTQALRLLRISTIYRLPATENTWPRSFLADQPTKSAETAMPYRIDLHHLIINLSIDRPWYRRGRIYLVAVPV